MAEVATRVFINECRAFGAKAERVRIANRQEAAKECPPGYPIGACGKAAYGCKMCWFDWLEAGE